MGRLIFILGLILVILGAAMTWAPWLVSWFGRLPGDIRIERPGGTVFIPLASMLLLSIVLTVVVNLFLRR
jgi:hypothetical protein